MRIARGVVTLQSQSDFTFFFAFMLPCATIDSSMRHSHLRCQSPQVRIAYVLWLVSALGFFVNWLTIIIAAGAQQRGIGAVFLASMASGFGLPLSWWLAYRGCYDAAQTDGATFR